MIIKFDWQAIQGTIEASSLDELRRLNSLVVDMINLKRRQLDAIKMLNLTVGRKVSFEGRRGQKLEGTITKINRTKVIVEVGTGAWPQKWRVSPSILTPLFEEAKSITEVKA